MSEPKASSLQCKFCGKEIATAETTCASCGYDSKTDTCLPHDKLAAKKKSSVDPEQIKQYMGLAVKVLVIGGIILLVFFFKGPFLVFMTQFPKRIVAMGTARRSGKEEADDTQKDARKGPSLKEKLGDVVAGEIRKHFFVVEGIFFVEGKKSYIIANGEILGEGDSFKGVTVHGIGKTTVVVEAQGKTQELGVSQKIGFPPQGQENK